VSNQINAGTFFLRTLTAAVRRTYDLPDYWEVSKIVWAGQAIHVTGRLTPRLSMLNPSPMEEPFPVDETFIVQKQFLVTDLPGDESVLADQAERAATDDDIIAIYTAMVNGECDTLQNYRSMAMSGALSTSIPSTREAVIKAYRDYMAGKTTPEDKAK